MSDHPDIEDLPYLLEGIPVRESIRQLFRDAANGTPDNISKAGCLALARLSNELGGHKGKGHVVWNAWRVAYPVYGDHESFRNHIDFSNKDFEFESYDFSFFNFGERAIFKNTEWGNNVNFQNTVFGNFSNFHGVKFGTDANFINSIWGSGVNFENASFGDSCIFTNSTWGDIVNFSFSVFGESAYFGFSKWGRFARFHGVCWGKYAQFTGSKWLDNAYFSGSQWDDGANFVGTQFDHSTYFRATRWGDETNFQGARFGAFIDFHGAQWGNDIIFIGTRWGNYVDFSGSEWEPLITNFRDRKSFESAKNWSLKRGISPNKFYEIDFSGAEFSDLLFFNDRKFLSETDFSKLNENHSDFQIFEQEIRKSVKLGEHGVPLIDNHNLAWELDSDQRIHVVFGAVPKFHGCEIHQDTSFEGAEFPNPTGSEEAARAYRTLKLAFSKQQAIREEQRFFRLEMEEETLRETGLKRWLFRAYKELSDYGFSITCPLKYGGLSVMALTAVYGLLSWLGQCGLTVRACQFAPQWLEFSLLQTLPLPGLDKLSEAASKVFWPVGAWWGLVLSALVILHKTISLAALFLVGLALRNLFKLK